MAISRSTWANEYVPGYFGLMIDSYRVKRAMSMWKDLVVKKNTKRAYEKNIERSGLGFPSIKGEGASVTFDTQIAGAEQTWVPIVYALGCRITEEAIDDNLYELGAGGGDKLEEIFKDLGEAMAENEETRMARFINSGSATTYHTTRNSKALFATDHPYLDGNTFSNRATGADLTYTTFWAAVIAAETQYNHRQYTIGKKVKSIWVSPSQERQAIEVLKSTDRPDTPNRAINAIGKSGRNISIKVWPYITDTDAWVLQLDGDGIIHFTSRKTRFAKETDFLTGDVMVKADQRWCAEINDPQAFYGNIP